MDNINTEIQLYFNEPDHKYTDQFNNDYTSSTTLVHKYVPKFQSNYWAKIKAAERGVTAKAIKDEWDFLTAHACDKGTEKHNSIEYSIKNTSKFKKAVTFRKIGQFEEMFTMQNVMRNPNIGEVKLEQFYEAIGERYPIIYKTIEHFVKKGYKVFAEVGIFSFKYLVSGMIDCFLIKGNEFMILDWKTNKNDIIFVPGYYRKDKPTGELTDVWVNSVKYMNYPLDNLYDCVGMHYTLQLSLYAYMTEMFGLKCNGLYIAHIRDKYELNQWGQPKKDPETKLYIPIIGAKETVQWHNIKYHKTSIIKMLNHHYEVNNINNNRLTQNKLF